MGTLTTGKKNKDSNAPHPSHWARSFVLGTKIRTGQSG
jgi:hypothetical protein